MMLYLIGVAVVTALVVTGVAAILIMSIDQRIRRQVINLIKGWYS